VTDLADITADGPLLPPPPLVLTASRGTMQDDKVVPVPVAGADINADPNN